MTFRVYINRNESCSVARDILYTEAGLHANWTAKTGAAIRRSLASGTWERGDGDIEVKAVSVGSPPQPQGPPPEPQQAALF